MRSTQCKRMSRAPRPRPRPSAAIVTSAVSEIGTNVERLLDFGARRLVVANVPDLATLPAVRELAKSTRDERATLAAASAISEAFDRELDAALDRIEARGRWVAPTPPDIERFDLRAALAGVQLALAARGGNAADACFDSEAYRDSAAAERIFHPACAPPTLDAAPRFARVRVLGRNPPDRRRPCGDRRRHARVALGLRARRAFGHQVG